MMADVKFRSNCRRGSNARAQSSVSLPAALSTMTLTPGRMRNIDQDMEALRASRQDNPFIQQIIASRESLLDDNTLDSSGDHVNLMAKDLSLELDVDLCTLPELHPHMIRSPPPVNWPHSSNASEIFAYSSNNPLPNDFSDCGHTPDGTKHSKMTTFKLDHHQRQKHVSWDGSRQQEKFSLVPMTLKDTLSEDSVQLIAND